MNKYAIGLMLLSAMQSASAKWFGQQQVSSAETAIEKFVNVGLYAVPYSEPLSVLLSTPNLAVGISHTKLNQRLTQAWLDYDDAVANGKQS